MKTERRKRATRSQVALMTNDVKHKRNKTVDSATSGSSVICATVVVIVFITSAWTMSGPEIDAPTEEYRAVNRFVTNEAANCVPTRIGSLSSKRCGAASTMSAP
jgi:hypothetical protein